MKVFKHIVNWIIWTAIGLYAIVMLAIHTPWVQRQMGSKVSEIVGKKLGTKVEVGRIDLGFLNRLILDSVIIYDQKSQPMLQVARMTATCFRRP